MKIGRKIKEHKSVKDNKGFTFVEIIVVLAIIGVLLFGVMMSTSLIHSNRMRDAIGDIDSLMSSCKISTMSGEGKREDVKLVISGKPTDGYVARLYTISSSEAKVEEFLGKGFDLTSTIDGSKSIIENLTIKYKGETGAIAEPATLTEIAAGDGSKYKITIHPKTGYHE